VVGRDNAHIPRESWPSFTWYLIEFAIVFAFSNLIAFQIIPTVDQMIGEKNLFHCEQVHGCLSEPHQRKKCLIREYYIGYFGA